MIWLGDVARRSAAAPALLLALLATAAAAAGCTTDHDALAQRPRGGSSAGGASGSAGLAVGGFGNAGATSQGGRVNPDDEPLGADVLTLVNGVVDAPSVRLCFARVSADGETSELVGEPLPELDYAASVVLTELAGLSLVDDVLEPWVLAGDFSLIEKLDCQAAVELAQSAEAEETPEDLRARALAALPAGTVDIGRSILLVLSGCIGGAAYTDVKERDICGDDYTPTSPTLQPIVVKLSRESRFDTVGLQGLHAALPAPSLDLRAYNHGGLDSFVFASAVEFGTLEPRPASTLFTPVELGVDEPDAGLQAVGDQGVVYEESWLDVFATSGLSAISASRTYTAVFLGPNPPTRQRRWWNGPAFAVVDNDPTRL